MQSNPCTQLSADWHLLCSPSQKLEEWMENTSFSKSSLNTVSHTHLLTDSWGSEAKPPSLART